MAWRSERSREKKRVERGLGTGGKHGRDEVLGNSMRRGGYGVGEHPYRGPKEQKKKGRFIKEERSGC